ncbi:MULTISPECIES: tRNA (5-methylaminomethyl-2-thiouridine)(34)-methyltransferase MnmD [unclassified Meiothermus]|uniref:tRNA (5-methylaminomethyl-2-thiouridine)(34)-methyltransferase MnmD n=1 Tax=unclassified Meiothermus TaxID=370471 RepID=UPI0013ED59C8|nr:MULTISPECIES: tRNA (5-methylaminomethyl-2-thiouridine)(34)-methyltransferase MnmD [unclassified Meiothermus]
MPFERLETADGSPTVVHPVFKEAYSSVHGALMQARKLYLELTHTHLEPRPRVLEVGFGLGVNFRVTLESALSRGVRLEYLGYEFAPLERSLLGSVEVPLGEAAREVWEEVLKRWPAEPLRLLGEWGSLEIRFEDVVKARLPRDWATAIYLDPFSPAVNPEPWSLEVMRKLHRAARPGAWLATYSVAGSVRRNLTQAGFAVERVPGMGKRAWLRACRSAGGAPRG